MLSEIMMSASKVQNVALLQIAPLQKLQPVATDHLLPRLSNYPGPCNSKCIHWLVAKPKLVRPAPTSNTLDSPLMIPPYIPLIPTHIPLIAPS